MALAPLDCRIQASRCRALSERDRTIYQAQNDRGNTPRGQSSSVSLAKVLACRSSARVLEHESKVDPDASHTNHAHPDDTLICGNIIDDVGRYLDDPISRNAIQRWKTGPGRKKAWKTAPRLRFANKQDMRLFGCSHQRNAFTRSFLVPLHEPELISFTEQVPISSSIPAVMLEHSMVGQNRNQMYPKPSTVKKISRRLGAPPSNMNRHRTRSNHMAERLTNGDGDDGVSANHDEDDDDSLELGQRYESSNVDFFPGMGDAM